MHIINQDELQKMTGGDEELVADLAIMFVQQLGELEAKVRIGIETGDASEVESAAHQLKSRVSYFGATELRQQIASFETAARTESSKTLRELQAELFSRVNQLVNELRTLTSLELKIEADE